MIRLTQVRHLWNYVAVIVCLCSLSTLVRAQTQIEDAIKQLSSANVRGYLQPLVDGFGANLNSGMYRSAGMADPGIHLKLEFVGMSTLIGDAEKSFNAVAPEPFDQTPVRTATIFGGPGTILDGPGGLQYHFQNGQVKSDFVPLVAPQVRVGNIYGTELIVRYVPIPEIDKFPRITLLGFGGSHSISQYIEDSPVDLAVGGFYQTLKIGDIISARSMNVGVQMSKSYSVFTVYSGLQYENSTINVSYLYTGYGATADTRIDLTMTGRNQFRATGGLGLDLFVLHLNADISVGAVTAIAGTVGFGL